MEHDYEFVKKLHSSIPFWNEIKESKQFRKISIKNGVGDNLALITFRMTPEERITLHFDDSKSVIQLLPKVNYFITLLSGGDAYGQRRITNFVSLRRKTGVLPAIYLFDKKTKLLELSEAVIESRSNMGMDVFLNFQKEMINEGLAHSFQRENSVSWLCSSFETTADLLEKFDSICRDGDGFTLNVTSLYTAPHIKDAVANKIADKMLKIVEYFSSKELEVQNDSCPEILYCNEQPSSAPESP